MKAAILLLFLTFLLGTSALFGQGNITFNNRSATPGTDGRAPVVAPIFGIDEANPNVSKQGNPSVSWNGTNGPAPVPLGTQTYNGVPLHGSGYTAQLWAANSQKPDIELAPIATTTFRTITTVTFQGFVLPLAANPVVPDTPSDPSQTAKFQLRVWDNKGGTITTWAQVVDPSNSLVPRGWSTIFTVPFQLGQGALQAPNLIGLESFGLFISPPALQIVVQGEGSVTKSPEKQPGYALGEQVTLTATPENWYLFRGWGDGITNNPRTITIGGNNSYTAIFYPTAAVETVIFGNVKRIAPVGTPAIFVDGEFVISNEVSRLSQAEISMRTTFPNGTILYTTDGSPPTPFSTLYSGPFTIGRTRTIRAVAYDAQLAHLAAADPLTVVVIPAYSVFTDTRGGGSTTVTPAGFKILSNTVVTLTAIPAPGWTFLNWLGDAQGTNATYDLLVRRDACVEAVFGTTLTTLVNGNGTIAVDPQAAFYPYGWDLTLAALPETGNAFALWGGGLGNNNPLKLQVTTSNLNITALFALSAAERYALTVRTIGPGHVITTPFANSYSNGQQVAITAIPGSGQFVGWAGQATGTQNPLNITIHADTLITALFQKPPPTLTLWNCLARDISDSIHAVLWSELGAPFTLETSSDLSNWSPILHGTNSFGRIQFDLQQDGPHQFYRAVVGQ